MMTLNITRQRSVRWWMTVPFVLSSSQKYTYAGNIVTWIPYLCDNIYSIVPYITFPVSLPYFSLYQVYSKNYANVIERQWSGAGKHTTQLHKVGVCKQLLGIQLKVKYSKEHMNQFSSCCFISPNMFSAFKNENFKEHKTYYFFLSVFYRKLGQTYREKGKPEEKLHALRTTINPSTKAESTHLATFFVSFPFHI